MRYLVLDHWSRRASSIHSLDAQVKLPALIAVLIFLSTASTIVLGALFVVIVVVAVLANLPVLRLLGVAAWVLPFSLGIALAAADVPHGAIIIARGYLSALAALLFAATTPLPAWTGALRRWGLPYTLLMTLEFVYRFLFVIAAEAQSMRAAARNRGGLRFSAAAGAVGVLFLRSRQRAESVHRAMIARGYGARVQ